MLKVNDVKKCNGFGKIKGLMFVTRKRAKPLLFSFSKPTKMAIHSWFVFFPFIALWLDDENKIIEKKLVRPFKCFITPRKSFHKLLEIPVNGKYQKIIELLDGD